MFQMPVSCPSCHTSVDKSAKQAEHMAHTGMHCFSHNLKHGSPAMLALYAVGTVWGFVTSHVFVCPKCGRWFTK